MRRLPIALPVLLIAAIAAILAPQTGTRLSLTECSRLSGGCEVTNWTHCAYWVQNGGEVCHECKLEGPWHVVCDNYGRNYACDSLYDTWPPDSLDCGTCIEPCGGTARHYGKDDTKCAGIFTTSSCWRTMEWAYEREYDDYCPPENPT